MTTKATKTKAAVLAHVQAVIAGTQKHFPNGTLTFGNATIASADLVKTLQGRIESLTALVAAQKGAKDALTAARATAANVGPTLRAFESFLHASFGSSAQSLADFDLVPRKPRKKATGPENVAKAEKAKVTRAQHGTAAKKPAQPPKG